jgi:hypothetical protein
VLANDIPAMELNSYEWELKIIQDGAWIGVIDLLN